MKNKPDIDKLIGNWIDKKCPKCGAQMLGNKIGDEWCSFSKCDYVCEKEYKELGLYNISDKDNHINDNLEKKN